MEYKGSGYKNLVKFGNVKRTSDEEAEEMQGHKPTEKDFDFDYDNFQSFDKTKGSKTKHSNIQKHGGLHIDRGDKSFMDRGVFSGRIQPRKQNYSPVRHNYQRMHPDVESSDSTEEISPLFITLPNTREEADDMLMVDTKQNDKPDKQLSETEKDRYVMQIHELLVEGKGCCGELVESISDLKMKIQDPETNNTQLVREFDCKEKKFSDLELKYRIIAKDGQCDSVLKQENGQHTAQVHVMQREINSLRNQLENKELEVKHMQAKYNELQKSHATIVEENSVRVRELQSEIYETQRNNANSSYENLKLKKKIDETLRELTLLSNRSEKFNKVHDSCRLKNDESFEYFKKNRSSLVDSTPTNYINEEINRLKQETESTKNGLHASGIEIKSLEGQLQLKIIENKHLIFASVCLSVLGFLVSVGTLLWS